MKRNFLLMLLLTLLPLAGWADSKVAKIGPVEYATLQEAITAVENGGTIVLQADITETEQVAYALGKSTAGSYTLDMNGHNITAVFGWGEPNARHLFNLTTSNTDWTITNSAAEGGVITGSVLNATADNDIVMIRVGYKSEAGCPSGSTLTIGRGVSVVSTNTMAAIDVMTNKTGVTDNVVKIYGSVSAQGKHSATGKPDEGYAVGTHGNPDTKGGVINVYDGAEINGVLTGIYLPGGECNIFGGTISGTTAGVIAKAGILNVKGGTITCTAKKTASANWTWDGGASFGVGYALQIEANNSYPEAPLQVAVSGGKFVGPSPVVGQHTDNYDALSKFLTGGNFSSNVADFVADGYVTRQAGDGSFNVIPGDLYELQVSPVNGIQMTYGSDFDLDVNKITITPTNYNTQPAGLKAAVLSLLKVNEDLSKTPAGTSTKYSVSLKDLANDVVIFPVSGLDQKSYIISPVGEGNVEIVKGKNELIEDGTTNTGYVFSLAAGLKYNADDQDLIVVPEDTKIATLGGVEFFKISETDYNKKFASDDPEHPTVVTPAAQYDITDEAGVLGKVTWSDLLPTGKDAGKYYVWAKAADGKTNYEGDDPVYVGEVIIDPNYPTLAGTITVDPEYYTAPNTLSTYWQGIHKKVQPAGTVYATFAGSTKKDDVTAKVSYLVLKGQWTDDHSYINTEGNNWTAIENVTFEEGYSYKIMAIYQATDNPNLTTAGYSDVQTYFDVVKPTLTLQTSASPTVVAYGVDPTFTFSVKEWQGYSVENGYTQPSTLTYDWYTKEECKPTDAATEDAEHNYPVGPYWVKLNVNDFECATHNIKVLPAAINVSQTDILAKINPQTKTFKYGQNLPAKLTYDDGDYPKDSQQAKNFENQTWYWNNGKGFTATKVELKGDKYEEVLGEDSKPVTYQIERASYPSWVNGHLVYPTTILPVGTWKITADLSKPTDGRKIVAQSAIWKVEPKSITDADAAEFANNDAGWWTVTGLGNDFDMSIEYTGIQIQPTGADVDKVNGNKGFNFRNKKLVAGVDYEISNYGANINAGEDAGSFTVTGKGNFTGTTNLTFDIEKATLAVKPVAGSMHVGDKTETYNVDWKDLYDQLKTADKKKDAFKVVVDDETGEVTTNNLQEVKGFSSLKVKRTVGSTVGVHDPGLKAYLDGEVTADNYNFTFEGTAPLTIEPGTIRLKLANQEVEYNGNQKVAYGKKFDVANASTLNSIVVENWTSLVDVDWNKITVSDNWNAVDGRYPAGTYTMTATPAAGAFTSTNYNVELDGGNTSTATLKVKPVALTITAISPEVSYALFLNNEGEFDQTKYDAYIESIESIKKTVEGVEVTEINPASVSFSPELKGGDVAKDVVAAITVTDNNEIVVTAATNANYKPITTVDGTLTITALPGIKLLSLTRTTETNVYGEEVVTVEGDLATINRYNNMPVESVELTLKPASLDPEAENDPFAKWNKGEWHAMVLPFDIKVSDVALAFGYGIVNVVDPVATEAAAANGKPNDVHFKLLEITEPIQANTPFCIKTDRDFNYAKTLKFGKLSVDPDATQPLVIKYDAKPSVEAGNGYKFQGTYEEMSIDKDKSYLRFLGPTTGGSKWYYIKSTSSKTYTMQPYTGFVNLGEDQTFNTREINFIFEEEDGSTTSINAADFMNGNKANAEGLYRVDGIKLQSAPTQKGVYIQDGKKFVK